MSSVRLGLVLVVAVAGCPSAGGGGGGACIPGVKEQAQQVLEDPSGSALAKAVQEYQPTDDELKLVAAYWALLAVGYQDGTISPAFFKAGLDQPIIQLTAHYPSEFRPCPTTTSTTQDFRAVGQLRLLDNGASGCSCSGSCLPSAQKIGSLLMDLGGLGLEIFSKTDKAKALVNSIRYYADDVVNKVNTVNDAWEATGGVGSTTYEATTAITQGMSKDDALKVLEGVGTLITAAGTIAGAAVVAGATAPALPVIAAIGAVVGAGIAGAKLGSKINDMTNDYASCSECRQSNCQPGSGGSGGYAGHGGTPGGVAGGGGYPGGGAGGVGTCGDPSAPIQCVGFCCPASTPVCGTGMCCPPDQKPCAQGCCPSNGTCPPAAPDDCATCCPGDSCCPGDLYCCGDCDTGC